MILFKTHLNYTEGERNKKEETKAFYHAALMKESLIFHTLMRSSINWMMMRLRSLQIRMVTKTHNYKNLVKRIPNQWMSWTCLYFVKTPHSCFCGSLSELLAAQFPATCIASQQRLDLNQPIIMRIKLQVFVICFSLAFSRLQSSSTF